ncbi:ATP-binding protein [Nocardioides baekrokdamisoli]|uniref:ATP-binding protein n=1 Tax=Nocardioides baekrokdamisoli TaxID=1804624 RepID=UPI0013DDC8D0|nr:LuxR C-terminal-related transcriptional regulator [Nocardioides baekrokdamisoli]
MTLVGPGGVGKTRLGYEVFDLVGAALDEAAWAVELADLTDPALIGHEVAAAVGAPVLTEEFDPSVLADRIGSHSALLYLDNCEHLIDECAELISVMLARCPGLRVLVSSRQTLGIVGEYVFAVPPLGQTDSVALFVARAREVVPNWEPSAREASTVASLCTRLDGIALGIELAASLTRSLPPEVIDAQLSGRLSSALPDSRSSAARHVSLDACFEWSYDLCTPEERLLWARASVFAGSFALSSAQDVCGVDGLTPESVTLAAGGLVQKSLLERDYTDPQGRYRMLEVVRQFGTAQLGDAEATRAWHVRHRDHYLGLAEEFDATWLGPGQLAWMDRFRADVANLRLAFEFSSASADEAVAALRMCAVLEHFFASTGGGSEALHWLRLSIKQGGGTERERAAALRVGCFIACLLQELGVAAEFHEELVPLVAATDDPYVHAHALYAEAVLRTWQNDAETGAQVAAKAITVFAELGDLNRGTNMHFLRGMMLGWADRPVEAAEAYQRCLDATQPLGERWLSSYSQWGLGVDRLLTGHLEEAIDLERRALATKVEFGDQLGTGLAIEALAWAAVEQDAVPLAALLSGAADAIWETLGVPVAGMPYLLRRRERAGQALVESDVPDLSELRALGATLPLAQVVEIACGRAPVPDARQTYDLTRREREVASLIAGGASNQAVADTLVISRRTAESHVERIMRKLGVRSRGEIRDLLR